MLPDDSSVHNTHMSIQPRHLVRRPPTSKVDFKFSLASIVSRTIATENPKILLASSSFFCLSSHPKSKMNRGGGRHTRNRTKSKEQAKEHTKHEKTASTFTMSNESDERVMNDTTMPPHKKGAKSAAPPPRRWAGLACRTGLASWLPPRIWRN